MVATSLSKGERLASALRDPLPQIPVPASITSMAKVAFDPVVIDLISPILELLNLPFDPSESVVTKSQRLQELRAPLLGSHDLYFNMKFRRLLQQRVKDSASLATAYTRLIESVIAPHLYDSLSKDERSQLTSSPLGSPSRVFTIRYQFPPSLRIHPPSPLFKRSHRDLEYGHQSSEINFWLPLTPTHAPNATMEIESNVSQDGLSNPYIPVRLDVGEIQRFHGTLLHHRVGANETDRTRVSLDFRVSIRECFDEEWRLPGLRIVHGYRDFEWRVPELQGC
ncbi:hypothetical protein HDU98_004200 [Podochytrium sp. JEL0797]|nr:hypothetical protein HDU98_004200 [Podochytrium sp. JEL0797]